MEEKLPATFFIVFLLTLIGVVIYQETRNCLGKTAFWGETRNLLNSWEVWTAFQGSSSFSPLTAHRELSLSICFNVKGKKMHLTNLNDSLPNSYISSKCGIHRFFFHSALNIRAQPHWSIRSDRYVSWSGLKVWQLFVCVSGSSFSPNGRLINLRWCGCQCRLTVHRWAKEVARIRFKRCSIRTACWFRRSLDIKPLAGACFNSPFLY